MGTFCSVFPMSIVCVSWRGKIVRFHITAYAGFFLLCVEGLYVATSDTRYTDDFKGDIHCNVDTLTAIGGIGGIIACRPFTTEWI